MPYPLPVFISEREHAHDWPNGQHDDAKWEDCVPCSMVMLVNAHKPGTAPATHTEAEALRKVAGYGPIGGTSIERHIPAVKRRYGIELRLSSGDDFADLWAHLGKGQGAVIIGKPANLPADHVIRKWVGTAFTGLHAVLVMRRVSGAQVRYIDPSAPRGINYSGTVVTKAELRRFYVGSGATTSIHKV